MSSSAAKEEIAEYLPPTRFRKDKPKLVRDKPIARPSSRGEALRHIEATYKFNDWKDSEQARNALLLGLDAKPVGEYSNDEMKIILDDFERRSMILFED